MSPDEPPRADLVPPPRAVRTRSRAVPELVGLCNWITALASMALGVAGAIAVVPNEQIRWAAFIPGLVGATLVVVGQRVARHGRMDERARAVHLAVPLVIGLSGLASILKWM